MKRKNKNKTPNEGNNRNIRIPIMNSALSGRGSVLPSIRPGMIIEPQRASNTDVLGSYTGVPQNDSVPTQDADDL